MYSKSNAPKIFDIIRQHLANEKMCKEGAYNLSADKMRILINNIIEVYRQMSFEERKDVLIPASEKFVENYILSKKDANFKTNYAFLYKWPKNKREKHSYNIEHGQYDRIGSPNGTYFCSCHDTVYDIDSRSLPYFFFEEERRNIHKCPSYHIYNFENGCLIAKRSITSPAFNQNGGSVEYVSEISIMQLMNTGKMKEKITCYAKV